MVENNGGNCVEKAHEVLLNCIDFERGNENFKQSSNRGSITKTTSVNDQATKNLLMNMSAMSFNALRYNDLTRSPASKHAHRKRENNGNNPSQDDAGDTGCKNLPQRGA